MHPRVANFVKWTCFISVNLCVIHFISIFNDNVPVFAQQHFNNTFRGNSADVKGAISGESSKYHI